MATVIPFHGMRFTAKAGDIKELCCPPYDIISEEQRAEYLSVNQRNIIRLELPEGDEPYKKAGELLESWLDSGVLAVDSEKCFYVYSEEFSVNGRVYSFKGIIGRVELREFSDGVILPHENTLSKAKEGRFRLMKATGCNFSQIYSLYFDKKKETAAVINEISDSSPLAEFTDGDSVTHRLWSCSDSRICDAVTAQFVDRQLFIADGHHRYETGLNYLKSLSDSERTEGSKYIMMMLVDIEDDGLVVLPTHRIVHGISGFDSEELLKKSSEYFDVESVDGLTTLEERLGRSYNEGKTAFGCLTGGGYSLLTLKDSAFGSDAFNGISPALRGLDVTVLHTLILERILGIDKANMAAGTSLSYTRSTAEGVKAVDGGANACFFLNPTRLEEIAEVAAAGEKMPQKSTYFYPKLITGLVMNKLDV